MDEMNVFLYVLSKEATDKIRENDAHLGTGGARRADGTLLEQAKPLALSLDEFNRFKTNETEQSNLQSIEYAMQISDAKIDGLEKNSILQYALTKEIQSITWEGFSKTLQSLERISNDISNLKNYLKGKDLEDSIERLTRYKAFLTTDAGNLRSPRLDVTNSPIAHHLDEIYPYIRKLINAVINDSDHSWINIAMIFALISPFEYVVKRFSALYYYENTFYPADYDEWIRTIEMLQEKAFRNKLFLNIRLNTSLPITEKLLACEKLIDNSYGLLQDASVDRSYALSTDKEEYMSIGTTLCEKIENQDYFLVGDHICIRMDKQKEIN